MTHLKMCVDSLHKGDNDDDNNNNNKEKFVESLKKK
jgi:hypothetical protein